MPIALARAAAFEILMRVETTDAYASELLHSARFAKLSPADHGLLTELVMGVLRWRDTLDERIAEHSSQSQGSESRPPQGSSFPLLAKPARSGAPAHGSTIPTARDRTGSDKLIVAKNSYKSIGNPILGKFDPEVLTALRLGVYQLLFLDRVPRHAAVNESVELVKRARKRSAAGLVNAVLRKIRAEDRPAADHAGHPKWLVERWRKNHGEEPARRICAYDQSIPVTVVRLSDPQQREELQREEVRLEPGALLRNSCVVRSGEVAGTKLFREKRIAIQDEASQLVALLVGKGKAILDCCAAPGGKTRILAEGNPDTTVIAVDVHPRRAALIKKLVALANVRVIAADARALPFERCFDRILVDAPCTGTGTLARNPEIKWRLKAEDVVRLQGYQVEILSAAMQLVSPGGRVIYSTCSLEPEENEQVVEKALRGNTGFRVVSCAQELAGLAARGELIWKDIGSLASGPYLRTIPGVHPCDGFFAAIIERM